MQFECLLLNHATATNGLVAVAWLSMAEITNYITVVAAILNLQFVKGIEHY